MPVNFNFFFLMVSEFEIKSSIKNIGTQAKKIKMVVGANQPALNKSPLKIDNIRNRVFFNMG